MLYRVECVVYRHGCYSMACRVSSSNERHWEEEHHRFVLKSRCLEKHKHPVFFPLRLRAYGECGRFSEPRSGWVCSACRLECLKWHRGKINQREVCWSVAVLYDVCPFTLCSYSFIQSLTEYKQSGANCMQYRKTPSVRKFFKNKVPMSKMSGTRITCRLSSRAGCGGGGCIWGFVIYRTVQ